jgi:ribosomal protein S20
MINLITSAVEQDELNVFITLRPMLAILFGTLSFICVYVVVKSAVAYIHGEASVSKILTSIIIFILSSFSLLTITTSDDASSLVSKTKWGLLICVGLGFLAIAVKLLLNYSDTIKRIFMQVSCRKRIEKYNYRSVDFSTIVELMDDILFSHNIPSNADFVSNIENMKSAYIQYWTLCAKINGLFTDNNYPFAKSISKQIEEMTKGLNNKISPQSFQICRILNDEQYKGTTEKTTTSIIQTITENVITTINTYTNACEELYTSAQHTIDDITTRALIQEYSADMDTSTSELDKTILNIQKLISLET